MPLLPACLALLLLGPAQGEIEPQPAVAIPLASAFQEVPHAVGRRGATTFAAGTAFATEGVDRFPFVVAVEADGAPAWRWQGDAADERGGGLFVPESGSGVFLASADLSNTVRVRRLDGGAVAWEAELPGSLFLAPLFDPVLELSGSADGGRLFALIERDDPFDLVVSLDPADGAVRWTRTLPTNSVPVALATDAVGGRVAVLANGLSQIDSDRLLVLDGAGGAVLATVPLGPIFFSGEPRHVVVEPSGARAFVGGRAAGPGGDDLVAVDLDLGATLWSAAVDVNVLALAYDPVGPDLVVASSTATLGAGQPLRVSGVRPALGVPQWSRVLDPSLVNGDDLPLDLDPALGLGALGYRTAPGPFVPGESVHEVFDLSDGASVVTLVDGSTDPWGGIAGGVFQTVGGETALVQVRNVSSPDGTGDLALTAFSLASAAPLWALIETFAFVAPRVESLWAAPEGDVAFLGVVDSGSNLHVARVDLTAGAPAWQTRVDGPTPDTLVERVGRDLAVSDDRSVVVTGRRSSASFDPPELLAFDGATGAALWERTLDGLGNVADLEFVESGVPAPFVLSLHGSDGTAIGGRTTLRATAPDGDLVWSAPWPATSGDTWRTSVFDVDADAGRVHVLVSNQLPDDQLRVLTRSLADGGLLGSVVLADADFAPGIELGRPLDADLERDPASGDLFVLGYYLGTLVLDAHLAVARVDPDTGAVAWGTALDPSPLPGWTRPESVHGPAAGVLAVAATADSFADAATVEVIGFDDATGAVRWSRSFGSAAEPRRLLDAERSAAGDALLISLEAGGASELVALDLASGAELWRTEVDGETDADRAERIASVDREVLALVGAELAVPSGAAFLARLAPAPLVGGPEAVSLVDPAPIALHLDRPAASAGSVYLVLGSLTGTAPPTPIGALELPLVPDAYTTLILTAANSGPFEGTLGALAALGDARAAVQLPPGLPPSLAGLELLHAFLELGPSGPTFASNAVGVLVTP